MSFESDLLIFVFSHEIKDEFEIELICKFNSSLEADLWREIDDLLYKCNSSFDTDLWNEKEFSFLVSSSSDSDSSSELSSL